MSYKEISTQLDLPVSTIETRLFRGRTMLRKALAGYKK
jgi:DNA-directed RNA polymerase specialized sigma24 family protein